MISFGLITEGITDQIVLENILFGFFNNVDIPINPLCPLRDATDKNRMEKAGNWVEVFEYCASSDFKTALFTNNFLIIQIDTDVLKSENISQKYQINLLNISDVAEIVEHVKDRFINIINTHQGKDFFETYRSKILFAIAVDSIECWLLPIYYENEMAKAAKTANCLSTLNMVLSKKENFTIDQKKPDYYRKISKIYRKQKQLNGYYSLNPSFAVFIRDIQNKEILVD